MAELNFPLNPTAGQEHIDINGQLWTYDTGGWLRGTKALTASTVGENLFINSDFSAINPSTWFSGDWTTNLTPVDGDVIGMGWIGWYAVMVDPVSFFTEIHTNGTLDDNTDYVVSWEGDGDGKITGLTNNNESQTYAEGPSPLLFSQTNTRIKFTFPLTAYNLKLEKGTVPTLFIPKGQIAETVASRLIHKSFELYETYNATAAGEIFLNRITYDLMLGNASTVVGAFGPRWPKLTTNYLNLTNCIFRKVRITNYGLTYELEAIAAGEVTADGRLYVHTHYT